MLHLFVGCHYEGDMYEDSFKTEEEAFAALNDKPYYGDYAYLLTEGEDGKLENAGSFTYDRGAEPRRWVRNGS